MIDGKRVLGLIPARGGSKGVPFKNLQPCGGKPLLQWTIEAARASKYLDFYAVSTDSVEIMDAAARMECFTVQRPQHLATDECEMFPVIEHAVSQLAGYQLCVLLQPTSPLRTAQDIDGALELFVSKAAKTLTSVYESHAVPFTGVEPSRRQDRRPMLLQNGAIYAFELETFRKTLKLIDKDTVPYLMDAERSVDVDAPIDMALASLLVGK